MSVAQILAFANQKGGVGKTTTTINVAAAMAMRGLRVLLVDIDPQGNASTGLGVDYRVRRSGTYALLMEGYADASIHETEVKGLSILPADIDLAGGELELVAADRREFCLRLGLEKIASQYDYILIDCPPSLGLLTLNALVAAKGVIVPLQCEFFALEGISLLTKTIERTKKAFNEGLSIIGIVLTMFDKRNNLSELVADDAKSFFGDKVMLTIIPRNVRISEAQSYGQPIMVYDPRSVGARAYLDLAVEIQHRCCPMLSSS